MFHKITIRWRLTILSALLLSICCIILTVVLNYSAFRYVDEISAIPLYTPAMETTLAQNDPSQGALSEEIIAASPTELQEAKQGFQYESIFMMLLIIFSGSALTYYISGKALKPLQGLTSQVKTITAQDLSNALTIPKTHDEIAQLTTSFNEMMEKLNEAFLIQKQFSSSAAHELRTPLAVLQTKVDVFQKKANHSKEDYDALLQVIEKQIQRLRSLVSNLLDMSNEVALDISTFDLKDSLEEVKKELAVLADQKNIKINILGNSSYVDGDVDALYRVFYNLIENAIKYNVENGYVEITIDDTDQTTTYVSFKDSAIGIPDEMKKHIFEPFYTVDKSRSRELGGVGLGLALANQIIKRHHGSLNVIDNETGGSCFIVGLKKTVA